MFQLNFYSLVKRTIASILVLSFTFQPSGFAARQVSTAKDPVTLDRFSSALLATRAEVRSAVAEAFQVRTDVSKEEKFFTNSVAVYNVANLFNKQYIQIPDEVMDAVRKALNYYVKEGFIKSAVANDVGGTHIEIHATHNFGEGNAVIHRIMYEALLKGLNKVKKNLNVDLKTVSMDEMIRKMYTIANDDSKVERGAESVSVAIGVGVGIGAANIKLFREFAIPGSTPLQKLGLSKSPGFRFRVKKTSDILAGKYDGAEWEFEISHTQYNDQEQVRLVDEKGQVIYTGTNESVLLLALASQPNDYQITAVYPVEGGSLPAHEPIATVVYQPIYGTDGKAAVNPVIIYRSQSGGDAVGGIGNMINGVNFVPGGENGDYFVATKPATMVEARKRPAKGQGYFVNYGYQSRNNGEIPEEGVLDHVEMHNFGYFAQKELADKLAKYMADHEMDQPYLSPGASERLVEHQRVAQDKYFYPAPKESENDPFLNDVNAKITDGRLNIVTDDKADMGGQWGHTKVPEIMIAVYRATLMEAMENGTIQYGNTLGFAGQHGKVHDRENVGVGDDGHLLMIGDRSENGAEAHQLSFLAFTRAYLFMDKLGKKPYGLGQDFAGPEAKAAKKNPYFYAKLSKRFFEILEDVMPDIEKKQGSIKKMKKLWREWQKDPKAQQTLAEPFSGNVSQQGMGSARYAFDPKTETGFDVIAGDKMGPAAFNRLLKHTVYDALKAGEFSNGLVFEIWDLKAFDENGKIPFHDFPKKLADVKMLMESALEGKIKGSDMEFVLNNAYQNDAFQKPEDAEVWKKIAAIFKSAGLAPNTPEAYENGQLKLDQFPQTKQAATEFLAKALKAKLSKEDYLWALNTAYTNEQLQDLDQASNERLEEILRKSGLVPAKRIFLDAQKNKSAIIKYLADSDRFNVKHVWGKKEKGWSINNPQKYLDRPLIGASVTRLGILSGGEYLGKDDPVMVGHSNLMKFAHEFLRTRPLIIQGDMNGSHWEWAMPSAMEHAVATERSFPILVGLRYTVSKDGKKLTKVEDLHGKKDFDEIRKEASRFNYMFDLVQMSQFEPHGTNSRTVEAAYELAKILRNLNKPNSPFRLERKKKERKERFFADPTANHLQEVYDKAASIPAPVRAEIHEKAPDVQVVAQVEKAFASVRIPETVTVGTPSESAKAVFSSKTSDALIVDAEFAFDKGGLALLPSLSGKVPSVVIVQDGKQEAFVAEFNEKLPKQAQVLVARSAQEAEALLKEEIAKYTSMLGGTVPGAYKIRALVADPTSVVADALREQLGDKWVQVVSQDMFAAMAEKSGLSDFVNQMQKAFSAASTAA